MVNLSLRFEVANGLHARLAAHASGGDGLSEFMVSDIAGGKYSRRAGLGALVDDDVAVLVGLDEVLKHS